ncbi:DUF2721 domain-containing protein [Desulfobaculum sp. SPO524]|uniref:DUF2721 domain-containing protein n=1 Tax=Desulfobaculum sp. SPO524 TaxID=3378071 RepID=UPI0038534393
MTIEALTRVLQACISPCVLISGVGLIVLSMTNRIGRPIDRIHVLQDRLKTASESEAVLLHKQIDLLFKRCRVLQTAISLALSSVFFVSVIILCLFATFVVELQLQNIIEAMFFAAIICLVFSMVFFLCDIRMTLNSLQVELHPHATSSDT